MPLALEVAAELRKLADALDTIPEQKLPYAFVDFHCYDRDPFLALAKIMPRPFKKSVQEWAGGRDELRLSKETDALHLWVEVPQAVTCTLIRPAQPAQPAVYDCDPLLSADEESELETV